MYFSMVENVIILQYICRSVIVLSISSLFLKTNTVHNFFFRQWSIGEESL